jgi:hypothetical protein
MPKITLTTCDYIICETIKRYDNVREILRGPPPPAPATRGGEKDRPPPLLGGVRGG